MRINLLPIIIMVLLFLSANYYVFYRIWHLLPVPTFVRIILLIIGILIVFSPFLSMLSGSMLPSSITVFLYKLGTSWLIIFLYLLITFLVADIIRITHIFPIETYLRNSWLGFGVIAGFITLIMSMGYIRYTNKERVELTLAVNKTLEKPLKILAVSDMHLGYGIDRKEFESWVKLLNKEEADILLIAGDITDNNVRPLKEQRMDEVFRDIQTKYGIYTVLGNHEYIANEKEAVEFLQQSGINVLRDSAVLIADQFYIVGRDDRSNPDRKSIQELVTGIDAAKPMLLLDHQPYNLSETEQNGIDLQFSGHTHKGQVWPISWVTQLLFEKAHGYLKKGESHIYVSSGLGIWGGKFRIGSQSEYVVIHLTGKEQ